MKVSIYRREGKVYWANWRDNGTRHRKSLGTENRKIAKELALEIERRLLLGDPPDEKPSISLKDAVEEYRAFSESHKRPKSHASDMGRVDAFRDFVGGEQRVDQVSTGDVVRWFNHKVRKDGVVPTTILRHREALSAFFNHMILLEHVSENPVSGTKRPRVPQRTPEFLSKDQIRGLLKAVKGDEIAPLVATLVYAGLRREEVCWLRPRDLDRSGKIPVLWVREKRVQGEHWLPKTKSSRAIPVSTKLGAILAGMEERPGLWLFPSPEGCRWDGSNLSRRFRKLMKAAGLTWNFLDLRHTFGSQLAQNGVSLIKIAKLMGNSPEIAQLHYINLLPEELAVDVEF